MFYDCALASNTNYMMVIKESHQSIMRRRTLEEQKRRIMNMDFRKKSDREDWERLNSFLQEKQKEPTQD